jgi:prepilin-type N-terminal cleavage/methylation domain-containing protein
MSKNKQIKHKGFTLLEILLVTGIISILAAIVIIAINPGRSLAKARDVQRKVGITEINKGLEQYYIDHNQYPTSINGPIGSLQGICNTGASATSTGFDCAANNLVDLSMLVPTYLPSIPADPTGVGYKVGFNSSRRIMLVADLTETVSPLIAIGTTTYPVVAVVEDTNPNIHIGDGSVGSPYQIANWSQLNHIRDSGYMNKYYILMSSLTSATYGYDGLGSAWTPIGDLSNDFTGNFNGNGKTISDLIINLPGASFVGLFGGLDSVGVISNVALVGSDITGLQYVGGIVGTSGGSITNSYNTGTVTGSSFSVGGIAGTNGGSITNSYNTGNITGSSYNVGGIAGRNGGSITNSYNTGNITGFSSNVGGIVGEIAWGSITNSYNTGSVEWSGGPGNRIGGVVGYKSNGGVTITNCGWYDAGGDATYGIGHDITWGPLPVTYEKEASVSGFYSNTHGVYNYGEGGWESPPWYWRTTDYPQFI